MSFHIIFDTTLIIFCTDHFFYIKLIYMKNKTKPLFFSQKTVLYSQMTININNKFFNASSSIVVLPIREQDELELHNHEFHELVLVLRGAGVHFTESDEYQICCGDVFLITPEHSHGYRNTKQLAILNILYLPEKMKAPLMDIKDIPGYHAFFELEPKMRKQHNFKSKLNLDANHLKKIKDIIKNIEDEIRLDLLGKNYICCSYFMQLKCFLARSYSNIKSPEGKAVIKISGLITYMEKNYYKSFTLNSLAKIAHMSKSTLNRNFLTATGMPPVKYLIKIRILEAANILRNNLKNVTETAFAVGFNDSNYFTKQFHNIMGISPKKYQKLSNDNFKYPRNHF